MHFVELTQKTATFAALAVFVIPTLIAPVLGLRITRSRVPSERATGNLTLAGLTASTLAALWLCIAWSQSAHHALEIHVLDIGLTSEHSFDFTLLVDSLSLTMMMVTSVIAVLVARFSIHYLHREPGFHRYFVMLNVFVAGMQLLVLAGTYDLLFVGWELVGLSSILLIGYFRSRTGPVNGAIRAMVTYRVADVGLLFAAVLIHHVCSASDFIHAFGHEPWPPRPALMPESTATVIGVLLLVSVAGKSAQFPLSGWLPRAMEGPTPSSALFYGALSVHAGIYLLLVSAPIFLVSRVASFAALGLGVVTAVHATVVGRVQSDAKSRLAYSTIAQVGLMVAAVGLHLFTWVVVHMVAHVCLRLYQLLRTPSALRDAQEMRAALADLPPTRPSFLYQMLPSALTTRLYFLALNRFFVDELLSSLVIRPALYVAGLLAQVDRRMAASLEPSPRGSTPATRPTDREAKLAKS